MAMAPQIQWRAAAKAYVGAPPTGHTAVAQPRTVQPLDRPVMAQCQRAQQPVTAPQQRIQALPPHMSLPVAQGSHAHTMRPQLMQQVARPIAVQMATPKVGHFMPPADGRRLETAQLQKERTAPLPTKASNPSTASPLSTPQLVKYCESLTQSCETKKQILAEVVKEQGRLLKERDALRKRKNALEGVLEAASGPLSLPAKEVEGPVVALPPQPAPAKAPAAALGTCAPHPGVAPLRASPRPNSGASTSPSLPVADAMQAHGCAARPVREALHQPSEPAPLVPPAPLAPLAPSAPCANKLLATLPAQSMPPVTSAVDRLLASQPAGQIQVGQVEKHDGALLPSTAKVLDDNPYGQDGQTPQHASPGAQNGVAATSAGLLASSTSFSHLMPSQAPVQDQPVLGNALGTQPDHQQTKSPELLEKPKVAGLEGMEPEVPSPQPEAPAMAEPERMDPGSWATGSPVLPIRPALEEAEEAAGTSNLQPSQVCTGSPAQALKETLPSFSESPSSPSQLPCSGDAAAGVGGPVVEEESKASPSAAMLGSLDGSSVIPDCDTLASKEESCSPQALQAPLAPASPAVPKAIIPDVSVPEEVMARAQHDGSIKLTWFFDEDLLEQLSQSGSPHTLSFEINQKSETMGGHVRIREHICEARLTFNDGVVQEQSFIVEGCAPGRSYSFSIRSRLQSSFGPAQVSDYSEPVTCSATGLAGSMRGPASLSSTVASTLLTQDSGSAKGDVVRPVAVMPNEADASGKLSPTAVPEVRRSGLSDEGCRLRQWLTEHKLTSSPDSTAASTAKSPNAATSQAAASVTQSQTDHSFLRRWLQDRRLPPEVAQPAVGAAEADATTQAQPAPLNRRVPASVDPEPARPTGMVMMQPGGLSAPVTSEQTAAISSHQPSRFEGADVDVTRLPPDHVPIQIGGSGPAERRVEANPPACPDFRVQVRADGTFIGTARSHSFGGVERRQTLASGGCEMPRSVRHCQPFSPVGRDLRGQLPMSVSITPSSPSGSFANAAGFSRPADALTTVTSLPQAGGGAPAWKTGQHLAHADPFQNKPIAAQGQSALLAPFGGMNSSEAANSFFGPINPNPFGAASIGTTRPFNFAALGGSLRDGGNLFPNQGSTPTSYMSRGIDQEPRGTTFGAFEPPPPPRSAPSLYGESNVQAPLMQPMPETLPWNEPRRGVGVTQNLGSLEAAHGPKAGFSLGSQSRYELRVRMSDSHWESLRFSASDDLDSQGRQFIQRYGLKNAFLSGLVARLRQMASSRQDYDCVDVVDLI